MRSLLTASLQYTGLARGLVLLSFAKRNLLFFVHTKRREISNQWALSKFPHPFYQKICQTRKQLNPKITRVEVVALSRGVAHRPAGLKFYITTMVSSVCCPMHAGLTETDRRTQPNWEELTLNSIPKVS